MKKNTINLLSGIILVLSIVLSGACKKVEVVDQKVGGCFDTDSPMNDASIDYDDGTCQYAYIDLYELTNHPDQDPANSGQDWDLIAVGDATRPDVILTITNQLTGGILFESPETDNIAPSSTPSWSAPYQLQLFNHNYEWTLYDSDVSGSELMAAGVFNPIELANNGTIRTGVANPLGDSTVITLSYTLK
jgi:hypothetical protein